MNTPASNTIRKPIAVLVIATGALVSLLGIAGAIITRKAEPLGWLIGAGMMIAVGCHAYYRRSKEEARVAEERTSRSSQRAT